jgi:hypothetical protein
MNNRTLGVLVLCAYLILVGVASLLTLAIPAWVAGVLALVAGVLILIGK